MKPLYWMHEQSGRMRRIVKDFLNGNPLSQEDFDILKQYVTQWIDGTYIQASRMKDPDDKYDNVMKGLAVKLKSISGQNELMEFISKECLEAGIDPF